MNIRWSGNNKRIVVGGLTLLGAASALLVVWTFIPNIMGKSARIPDEKVEETVIEESETFDDGIEEISEKTDTEIVQDGSESESIAEESVENKIVEEPVIAEGKEDDSDGINRNYKTEDYMKYKVLSSYFFEEDLKGYELVISQANEDEDYVRDVKVFVSKLEDETYVLMQVLEDKLHDGDAWDSEGLHLVDVNFDGEKDIIVQNGHYGNQGAECYSCYLYYNGSYQQCDSFSEIPNASVDAQNQYMLGSWRNSAASQGYGIYLFENGRYRLCRMLTLEFLPNETAEDEGNRVLWLDEEYDGDNVSLMNIENAAITEQFSIEADYESDIVQEKFLGSESFWKLDDYDRWNSFHPRSEVTEED